MSARVTRLIAAAFCALLPGACSYLPERGPEPAPVDGDPAPVTPPVTPPVAATVAPSLLAIARADGAEAAAQHQHQRLRQAGLAQEAAQLGYFVDVLQARLQQLGGHWQLQREGERLLLRLPGALSFAHGRVELSDAAGQSLGQLATVLAEFRQSLIRIHGHTDSSGAAEVNQRLSEQRALAVAQRLLAGGVARERLLIVGYGASQPLDAELSEVQRERNRRVELWVEAVAH